MVLLNTNICIHIINAMPPAVLQRFRDYRTEEIGICNVVTAELAHDVTRSGSARNRRALDPAAMATHQDWIRTALALGACLEQPTRLEPFGAEGWLLDPEGNRLFLLVLS